MTPQERFVTRLRRERQRREISLDDIAAGIRVKRELLEALEQNDLSHWPRGLYARAWIRAYALAVNLDPGDTVDEFCRHFAHGDRRARKTIEQMAELVASPVQFDDSYAGEERRRDAHPADAPPPPAWHAPLSEAGRLLMIRLGALKHSPYLRPRRSTGTSS